MKIKTTEIEIECTTDELRQSTTLSDGLYNALRRAFNGPICDNSVEENEDDRTRQTDSTDR